MRPSSRCDAHARGSALFTDIDLLVIATAFIKAVKNGRVKVAGVLVSELENMETNQLIGFLIRGRGYGTVQGRFSW